MYYMSTRGENVHACRKNRAPDGAVCVSPVTMCLDAAPEVLGSEPIYASAQKLKFTSPEVLGSEPIYASVRKLKFASPRKLKIISKKGKKNFMSPLCYDE
ncbi:hypothetical protein TNCV_4187131 [Trichonephila clavipes]|nr:hypothetical protein TNCV_4187131 [Trichonephila clavipes]